MSEISLGCLQQIHYDERFWGQIMVRGGWAGAGNNFGQQFNSDHKAPTVAKRREAQFESGIGQRINHNTAMSSQFETVLTQFMVMANLTMLLMTMMLLLLLLLRKMAMILLLLMMTMLLPLKLRR